MLTHNGINVKEVFIRRTMPKNYWYIIAESKELGKKPVRRVIFNCPIALFRSGGEVSAIEDRCAHRNVPLSEGKICNGNIQCPYHGWEYDGSGKLVNIPSLGKDEQKNISIKKFRCKEQDGYIWICVGDSPVTDSPPRLPHFAEKGWTSFRMQNFFNAGVEQCLENFLDCPHAVHVHKSWFRSPTNRKVKTIVRTLEDGAEAEYFNEPRKKSIVHKTLLFGKNAEMKHTDRFIAPATSRVDYVFSDKRHYIITSHCTPVNDIETMVYTTITFKFRRIGWLVRLFFKPLSKLIIKQDVDMLAMQGENIKSFGGKPKFAMSKADLLLPHIKAWRKAISNNDSPPKAGQEKAVEIYL